MAIDIGGGVAATALVPEKHDPPPHDPMARRALDQISPQSAADVVRQLLRADDRLTTEVARFDSAI